MWTLRMSRPQQGRLAEASTAPLLFLVVAVTAILVSVLRPLYATSMSLMLVDLVFVVGLFIFVGNSGIFSFGHVAFMAMGAYCTAVLTIPVLTKQVLFPGMPAISVEPLLAVPLGGVLAAVAAAVTGIPLMRLSGLVASLGTFALLSIVYNLANNLEAVTGGSTGVSGVPRVEGNAILLGWVFVALVIAWLYGRSSMALLLRASREDPVAAEAAGVQIGRQRLVAFVLSAFFGGVAGGLYALQSGSFVPASFYLVPTFLFVAMLVVGGKLSLTGAVAGVLLLTFLREFLASIEETVGLPGVQHVGLALAMLLTLLLRPDGLFGDRDLVLAPRGRQSALVLDAESGRP